MTSKTYRVDGMTCDHCVKAVRGEVAKIPGVTDVAVDLEAARLSVTGADYSDEQVRAAVAEAGYELADA